MLVLGLGAIILAVVKAQRGTQDIKNDDAKLWQHIEDTAARVFYAAKCNELRTPIFESTELFSRAVGEGTDIVNKEMYTFEDKGGRSITLRPEGTAGIVRAFIEHGYHKVSRPSKFWYRGPMFRYERPQTGRFRQFHQIGLEALGSKGPYVDIELISLALALLKELGLKDLKLYINSIGNVVSRASYKEALKEFLAGHLNDVCEDCQTRYEQNPLRVLDCKVPEDQEIYKNAPKIHDYFDDESHEQWQAAQDLLKDLNIDFEIDPKLVRGLDYYSHMVFEIKTEDPSLGQQSTVLAGGRYDHLVQNLGGAETPSVGWALGIERLAHLIKVQAGEQEPKRDGYYIISDDAKAAQIIASKLREQTSYKVAVEYDYDNGKFKKQMDKANKRHAKYVIFYMADERESNTYKVKNLETGDERSVSSMAEIIQ